MDYEFWAVFFVAALALNISPGPDLLFILTKTLAHGKRAGIFATLGVCTGAFFHVVAAAVGISLILTTSALAFSIVKCIGAAYLLYLGFQALRSSSDEGPLGCDRGQERETPLAVFRQGVAIDILNPKVAVFFMAFLPQFVRESHGPVPLQLLLLGTLIIAMGIVVEIAFVLSTCRLGDRLRESGLFSAWGDRLVGMVFVGLAIKLFVSTNV